MLQVYIKYELSKSGVTANWRIGEDVGVSVVLGAGMELSFICIALTHTHP